MVYSITSLDQFGQLYDLIKTSFFLKLLIRKNRKFQENWNVFNDSVGNLGFPLQNPQKQTKCILKSVIQIEQLKKAVKLHIVEFRLCFYRYQFKKILNLSTKTTRQINKEQ